jgi:nucleoside-triphosphatase THEP1
VEIGEGPSLSRVLRGKNGRGVCCVVKSLAEVIARNGCRQIGSEVDEVRRSLKLMLFLR